VSITVEQSNIFRKQSVAFWINCQLPALMQHVTILNTSYCCSSIWNPRKSLTLLSLLKDEV
jgi:hypothetical protein